MTEGDDLLEEGRAALRALVGPRPRARSSAVATK